LFPQALNRGSAETLEVGDGDLVMISSYRREKMTGFRLITAGLDGGSPHLIKNAFHSMAHAPAPCCSMRTRGVLDGNAGAN